MSNNVHYETPNKPITLKMGKYSNSRSCSVTSESEDIADINKTKKRLFLSDEDLIKSKKMRYNHNVDSIIDNYVGHITSININDMECPNDYNIYMIKSNYENTLDNTRMKLINFVNKENIDYYVVIKANEQYNISNMMTSRVRISTYLRNSIAIASFLSVLKEENVENVQYNFEDFLNEKDPSENELIIEMINLIFDKNRSTVALNKEWMLFPYIVNVLSRIGSVGMNDIKDYFYEMCEGTDEDTDTELQTLIETYCIKMNNEEIVVNNKYFTEIYNARIKKNNAILSVVNTITKENFYNVIMNN